MKGANSTYHNPVLPGWHSDPSCVHVKGVTYCCTSTFESFPGMPIYASRDLVHWEHISNTWNREEQLPGINFESQGQQDGFFAPNLRYRDGQFYMTSVYAGVNTTSGLLGTVFSTSNPYSDAAWSRPLTFDAPYRTIDPDLFWDDDGSTYLTWSGVSLQPIDLSSGELGDKVSIWNGTGGVFAEGPHMYRKDGYYYLLVAEGGTQLGHMATVARSKDLRGLTSRIQPIRSSRLSTRARSSRLWVTPTCFRTTMATGGEWRSAHVAVLNTATFLWEGKRTFSP